jgi:surfeit locus 1 family protein
MEVFVVTHFKNFRLQLTFKPTLVGTIATAICIPLFIHLGMWQYNKAAIKQRLQSQYEANANQSSAPLPKTFENLEALRYKSVSVEGEYLPQFQILLDNQVEAEVAGYHVITPLRLSDRKQVILVDRGWVAALPSHADLPNVETPTGAQKIEGQLWLPSQKFYTLSVEANSNDKWQTVWQNMDMQAYATKVPFEVAPVVLRMSPQSSGGFVRNWVRPDDRILTHLSYAYQWFGFAFATLVIYIFVGFKRGSSQRK